jgi:hypothetical protein
MTPRQIEARARLAAAAAKMTAALLRPAVVEADPKTATGNEKDAPHA